MAAAESNTFKFYHGFPTPGPQSPTSDDVMKHIFFTKDEDWKRSREADAFDYVVVGSGFCGYAFVHEIFKFWAENEGRPKPKVLLLERGPFFLPEHFQNLPRAFSKTVPPEERFMSETFPWTLSHKTIMHHQPCKWMHGMVPFVGGRSTLWSAWCPRPSLVPEDGELRGWPERITAMMTPEFFESAEKLLNVRSTSDIPVTCSRASKSVGPDQNGRVYGVLQDHLVELLQDALKDEKVHSATRAMAAPLAIGQGDSVRIDFAKFSVVGPLLDLAIEHKDALRIVTNCTVERIIAGDEAAVALETSRGVLPLITQHDDLGYNGRTKLVLAMGCMPAATLLLNSFPADPVGPIPGRSFSAHFITAVTARIRRDDFNLPVESSFELGAIYLGGYDKEGSGLTWHAQISVIRDEKPDANEALALRYQPDVVASATAEQLRTSGEHVVFVFAVLGEMDADNAENYMKLKGTTGADVTANCTLQFAINENDKKLWDAMDKGAYDALNAFSGEDMGKVELWCNGAWKKSSAPDGLELFSKAKFRVPGLVHESSLLGWADKEEDSCVTADFRFKPTNNVYITGASLWPTGSSWNPTLTMVGFAQKLARNLSSSPP